MQFSFGFFLALLSVVLGVQGSFLFPAQQQQPGGGGGGGNQSNIPGGQVQQANGTITSFIQTNQSFGVLNKLLNDTGLSSALNSTNATLFAPNDQAINNLPSWIVQHVQNATNSSALPALQALLLYHIHPGKDFRPQNFSSSQNQTVNASEWTATWRAYDYLTRLQQGGDGNQTGNQTQTSQNATSLSTAIKPLNLTIYTNNQSQWFVNDAEVLSVTNTTNGYVFELSKVVTPLYYLNSSIYNLTTEPPPQLGSNYTFPQPPTSPPEINLTTSEWKAYSKAVRQEWQNYDEQIQAMNVAYSFGLY